MPDGRSPDFPLPYTDEDAELVIDGGRIRMDPAVLFDPQAFEVTPREAGQGYVDRMAARREDARTRFRSALHAALSDVEPRC